MTSGLTIFRLFIYLVRDLRLARDFGFFIPDLSRYLAPEMTSFIWSGIRSNGPKMPIFGKNASFGPNLAVFWPKIQFFGGRE